MYKASAFILTITIFFCSNINAATIERADTETGQLEISEELFKGLAECDKNVVEVEPIDKHQYRALKLIPYDIIIKPPTDCWALYRRFMSANAQKFKDIANKTCKNYIGCWCCPRGGLCVTFIVKPDFWRCFVIDFPIFKEKLPKIPVFEVETDITAQ
ncbi:unnamed protein product [Adineta ricciae]|uniref:Uncharacterized protein n=1 Tax=Adineta ricciae TaxID=249248 RepID=A0A815CHP9_ADIRI|nr:unnamed protein product [Adineta ricciae]CAF1287609.1 unnamed protein product [Adineta ricciae]